MRPPPTDPDAWNAHLAEGNATQARKRVAADALIRDAAGHILLVNPTYKAGWDLPGGMSEANEPPHQTVVRELAEELGLTIHLQGLLVVDWVPPHGPWDDELAFIFDGGVLDHVRADTLRPQDGEVSEAAFIPVHRANTLLRPRLRRRLDAAIHALADARPRYLQDGLANR